MVSEKVKISLILPDPNNPRKIIDPEDVGGIAASIPIEGLKNPVKVRPLSKEEQAKYQGYLYMLISGHKRLLALQKLGMDYIDAFVLNITPEEAFDISVVDNKGKGLFWLEEYEAIERMEALHPGITQQELADRVIATQQFVSRAQKALPLLTKSARESIYTNYVKSGGKGISEAACQTLLQLAYGGYAKDPDLPRLYAATVECGLNIALERNMTEAMVDKMCVWWFRGNRLDTFPLDGNIKPKKGTKKQTYDPNDPAADRLKALPKNFVWKNRPKGVQLTLNLSRPVSMAVAYAAAAELRALEQKIGNESDTSNPFLTALPELRQKAVEEAKAQKAAKKQSASSGGNQELEIRNQESSVQESFISTGSPVLDRLGAICANYEAKTFSDKMIKKGVEGIAGWVRKRKKK